MQATMRSRYFFLATIPLALAVFMATFFALHEHKALQDAGDAQKNVWGMLEKVSNDVKDYACDDIDGMNCYLIMREFHSKGLKAAMEKEG
jgi:hypothetical protein